MSLRVLSLFDGMSCGMQALKDAGIDVQCYHAYEIDPHAIAVSKANHPEIVHFGDVNQWRDNLKIFPYYDLILAGSPCQAFSFAGGQVAFDDPRGQLFFVFADILDYVRQYNPDVKFLLENVVMKQEFQQVISDRLGVEPVMINSNLLSAQNRKRLYWANFPIVQPEDEGIMLRDVVFDDALFVGRVVGRRMDENGVRHDYDQTFPRQQRLELRTDGKTGTLTTVQKDNTVLTKDGFAVAMSNVYGGWGETKNRTHTDKSPTLRTPAGGGHIPSLLLSDKAIAYMDRQVRDGRTHWDFNHHSDVRNEKSSAVVANFFKGVPYNVLKDWNCIRQFHPVECERLQTLPDGYTQFGRYAPTGVIDGIDNVEDYPLKPVSKTQRLRMIGNGWTVAVIVHIFTGLWS